MDRKRKELKVKAIPAEEQKDHMLAFCACGLFALTLLASIIN